MKEYLLQGFIHRCPLWIYYFDDNDNNGSGYILQPWCNNHREAVAVKYTLQSGKLKQDDENWTRNEQFSFPCDNLSEKRLASEKAGSFIRDSWNIVCGTFCSCDKLLLWSQCFSWRQLALHTSIQRFISTCCSSRVRCFTHQHCLNCVYKCPSMWFSLPKEVILCKKLRFLCQTKCEKPGNNEN